jgi:short-subunit dehydrogenase
MKKNKNILILGANSDIAIAIGREFASKGSNIFLASRNLKNMEIESQHLELLYKVKSKFFYFDASDFASHNNFINLIDNDIDGVVLCFGNMPNQVEAQNNFKLTKECLEVNYVGAVSILEIFSKYFVKKKNGWIIGVSSVAGDRGRSSNYIYGSSKAALSAYLQGLNHRLSSMNIHVMLVKPGFVDTKLTAELDLPGFLTASTEEVAKSIYKGLNRKKNEIYIRPIWRFIMLLIKLLPYWIFKKTKL